MTTNFHRYHDSWTDQLRQLTTQLTKTPARLHSPDDNHQARRLVEKVVAHYEDYHRAKSGLAQSDILALFAAPWASTLERALYWVAGFRPTTIFHLVYTESSIRFESRVADILRGRRTGDLGELSPAQLARVSELQCLTVKEENEIGDELGAWQEAVAGAEAEWAGLCGPGPDDGLEGLLERLARVVARADQLRMRTMRQVVELLTPQQATEFLIAAAELQFGIRAWGIHHDRARLWYRSVPCLAHQQTNLSPPTASIAFQWLRLKTQLLGNLLSRLKARTKRVKELQHLVLSTSFTFFVFL